MRIGPWVGFCYLLCLSVISINAQAAPACKGPSKNDPGCPGAEEPPPPEEAVSAVVVDSAAVDWFNQRITVRGSGLVAVTQFTIGGSGALAEANESDSQLDLLFNAPMAAEVNLEGTYFLKADGTDVISIYFKTEVVDPADTVCPCEADWLATFGAMGWWPTPSTECVGYDGPSVNDPSEIAAIVLSDPEDETLFPHYPAGASFLPGDPINSYCSLTQLNADATYSEVSRHRINEGQQATCAVWLQSNVCSTTVPE